MLVPLVIVGAWARRRSDDFLPWFLYAGILLLGATLLFIILALVVPLVLLSARAGG